MIQRSCLLAGIGLRKVFIQNFWNRLKTTLKCFRQLLIQTAIFSLSHTTVLHFPTHFLLHIQYQSSNTEVQSRLTQRRHFNDVDRLFYPRFKKLPWLWDAEIVLLLHIVHGNFSDIRKPRSIHLGHKLQQWTKTDRRCVQMTRWSLLHFGKQKYQGPE